MEELDRIKLEAKLLEQEHRPTHLLLNFLRRKKKWPNDDDPRRKAVQKAIIWRLFFSPAVLAVGGSTTLGIITALVMLKQNNLLTEQNLKLIEQNNLIEADRRSAQIFVMSDVMQDLQNSLKDSSEISNVLISRIIALTKAMKPYKYLTEGDTLSELISPERGQLLSILINSDMNENQLLKILSDSHSDFSYTELTGYRSNIPTKNSTEILPRQIKFGDINLANSNLEGSDFTNASFYKATLASCILTNVNFSLADVINTSFNYSEMFGAAFIYTDLSGSDFSDADLTYAHFENANLSEAIFENTDLTDTKFKNVIVENKDWIEHIKALSNKGVKRIDSLYKIIKYDKNIRNDFIKLGKGEYYQIVLKNES